jgi:hypothetical protein
LISNLDHRDIQHYSGGDVSIDHRNAPSPTPTDIDATARLLRAAIDVPLARDRCAAIVSAACRRITVNSDFSESREPATALARHRGWSEKVVHISLEALTEPFRDEPRLAQFARTLASKRKLVGFVMASNIPGAGLHELITALLAGCAVMVKTSTAEPIFFAHLARVIAALDPQLGARIAVFNWPRERTDLTTAMRNACDLFVAFGADATIAQLQPDDTGESNSRSAADFAGFGARVSGMVLIRGWPRSRPRERDPLWPVVRDIIIFEQRGCLSPHHVFVEDDGDGAARAFAEHLASSLASLPGSAPPRELSLEDAAAIRRVRETARWREIGGHPVHLWESPWPSATVIYDRDASFTVSPGYRVVFVSPFRDAADLERRLAPVHSRIEAFGFGVDESVDPPERCAEIRSVLERIGATYICNPGRMQSPPPDWPHGGGAFLRMLLKTR